MHREFESVSVASVQHWRSSFEHHKTQNVRPNSHWTRACKFAGNSFDVTCEHCHSQQKVPCCVCASLRVQCGFGLKQKAKQAHLRCYVVGLGGPNWSIVSVVSSKRSMNPLTPTRKDLASFALNNLRIELNTSTKLVWLPNVKRKSCHTRISTKAAGLFNCLSLRCLLEKVAKKGRADRVLGVTRPLV